MQSNAPKYTQAALGRFRKGLLKLLQEGPSNEDYGVCFNLNFELRTMPEFEWGVGYDFVFDEAQEWPHAMRREDGTMLDYFVPHHNGVHAVVDEHPYSMSPRRYWEGENLKMRQNLIQYLLGRVAHHESMLRGGVALAG